MFHLLYASRTAHAFTQRDLGGLLARARTRNRAQGITGMLIHKEGRFLQVLEGEEAAVRSLFAAIVRDGRHRDVTVLAEGAIPHRNFPDWSMGFQELGDSDLLGLYGHTRPLGKSLNIDALSRDATACLELLRFIRDLRLTRL